MYSVRYNGKFLWWKFCCIKCLQELQKKGSRCLFSGNNGITFWLDPYQLIAMSHMQTQQLKETMKWTPQQPFRGKTDFYRTNLLTKVLSVCRQPYCLHIITSSISTLCSVFFLVYIPQKVFCSQEFASIENFPLYNMESAFSLIPYLLLSQSASWQCPAVHGMQPNAKLFHLPPCPCNDPHCCIVTWAIFEQSPCILPG